MNTWLSDASHPGQVWQVASIVLVLASLGMVWLGLMGGRNGARGLLRSHESALRRAEGWRVAVLGTAAAGLGVAGITEAPVFLFLALGIGFVELLEASFVIAVWRWGDRVGKAAANQR